MSEGLNPELQEGDEVICYHMDGEMNVPPGTKGTVVKIQKDPIISDAVMYKVKWENGSTLPLLSDADTWKKVKKEIKEEKNGDPLLNLFKQNRDVFKNFDLEFFRDYFLKLRDSGIVNMFGAYPLVYAGRDHIERYYGEGREDDEAFQELLEVADLSRDKLVQGILKYLETKNEDLSLEEIDMDEINRLAKVFAKDLFQIYVHTF